MTERQLAQQFERAPKFLQSLVQVSALGGKTSLRTLVEICRLLVSEVFSAMEAREVTISAMLKQHPALFEFSGDELGFELANCAFLSLDSAACKRWLACMEVHARDAYPNYDLAVPLLRLVVRLRMMAGYAQSEIHDYTALRRLGAHFGGISQSVVIPLFAPEVCARMHDSLKYSALARFLHSHKQLPRQHFALDNPMVAAAADSLADFDELPGPGQQQLLEVHAELLFMAGACKPAYLEHIAWLDSAWDACAQLVSGQLNEAFVSFELAQKRYRAHANVREFLPSIFGAMHAFALFLLANANAWKQIDQRIKKNPLTAVEAALQQYALTLRNAEGELILNYRVVAPTILDTFVNVILQSWRARAFDKPKITESINAVADNAQKFGFNWIALEIRRALEPSNLPSIAGLKSSKQPWEELLEALQVAQDSGKSASVGRHEGSRLQVVLVQQSYVPQLYLAELRSNKAGVVAPKGIFSRQALTASIARLDNPADLRIANYCRADLDFDGTYHSDGLLEKRAIWDFLIGHPDVFYLPKLGVKDWDSKIGPVVTEAMRVSVKQGPLSIQARKLNDGSFSITKSDTLHRLSPTLAFSVGDGVLNVIEINAATERVLGLLAKSVAVPMASVSALAGIATRNSRSVRMELRQSDKSATAADSQIHILLEPTANGITAVTKVRPFGPELGPYFDVGDGDSGAVFLVDGELLLAKRNFAAERTDLAQLIAQAPRFAELLAAATPSESSFELGLDALDELQALSPAPIIGWPKGRGFKVLPAGKFDIRVSAKKDWLGIEGEVEHSDGAVKLAQLIALLASAKGRYVKLDEQRYLKITEQMRQRAQSLSPFVDGKGNITISTLAGSVLADSLALEPIAQLKKAAEKMQAAFALNPPVPKTLQAELRDYQIEGFRWLLRMAHWGAGACLADDMGLGKTVQTIAALLARAPGGPCMVVAPTSVIGNWQRELIRFAPTLNVWRFDALDRQTSLPKLGPFDVLLMSYGLMSLNVEQLEKTPFHTLVLDEAQAIKNASTQRAKAACQLDAKFRISLSGTPLENHLGELWSQMRFLNPGLFGSEEHFQKRFTNPIERDPQHPVKATLRKLIAPFLLRRTKAQVLAELPEKTEITLTIEPSAAELEFMQGLRLSALQKLGALATAPSDQRFHILAEITRLRRAACHPSLVAPELKIGSAKLAQLLELLQELKENKHRALVFSQFVDYLEIVKTALDAAGLSYQYLDGATPAKVRDQRVQAFQAGESDLFLLSLKAGGVGLNLTAADYVIHLDPWWNPAVEQQASDRAHRIGQTRPVTIYRLVMQGSIEEQILTLHGQKRELIDAMLSERETAKVMSPDELMALIAG